VDATAFIQSDIATLASEFDVHRPASDGAYNDGFEMVGTARVHVFSPSSQHQVVVEGSDEKAAYTGLATVSRDANDEVVHDVQQDDQLRRNGHHYDVRVKHGEPNDHNPEFWKLGLDKANTA